MQKGKQTQMCEIEGHFWKPAKQPTRAFISEDGQQVKRKEADVMYMGRGGRTKPNKPQNSEILAFHTGNLIFSREGSNLLVWQP